MVFTNSRRAEAKGSNSSRANGPRKAREGHQQLVGQGETGCTDWFREFLRKKSRNKGDGAVLGEPVSCGTLVRGGEFFITIADAKGHLVHGIYEGCESITARVDRNPDIAMTR